jgi:hypothetical protein
MSLLKTAQKQAISLRLISTTLARYVLLALIYKSVQVWDPEQVGEGGEGAVWAPEDDSDEDDDDASDEGEVYTALGFVCCHAVCRNRLFMRLLLNLRLAMRICSPRM